MTVPELKANFDRAHLTYQTIGGDPEDWNAPGTQAFFAVGDKFAIVAFRGTERDDPDDLFSDADLVLVPELDYRPAPADAGIALGHLGFVTHLFSLPCLVHRGFQQALNQVWKDVHRIVTTYRTENPGAEICFTGHSLGAALAVLAFSRFADFDMSLYTFGCPRVGDGAFRNRVLANPGKGIYRYVNHNDAVAHVPLESLLYLHAPGPCYRFSVDGYLETDNGSFLGDVDALRAGVIGLPASITIGNLDSIMAPPSLVDHSPARYCFRLWDCV